MSRANDILIFKRSYELAQQILKATRLFPKSQRFLMASRLEETIIVTVQPTKETIAHLHCEARSAEAIP